MTTAHIVRIHKNGGPESMQLDAVDLPERQRGEVLVAVKAAGVNFLDTQLRAGLYPRPLPLAMGNEGAGIVLDADVDAPVRKGDAVAWAMVAGAYATHALVPHNRLVKLPAGLDLQAAAASFMQGLTAHYLTQSTYPLKVGETCIVHSAAGGVGTLLCQMAKNAGAKVIGTVSSEAKVEVARAAGADQVVIYTKDDFAKAAQDFTKGRGVDVVYDAVGKDTFDGDLAALKNRGTIALYGEASGEVPPVAVRRLAAKSLYLTRTGLGSYIFDDAEFKWRAEEVMAWLANGKIKQTFKAMPLSQAADAHIALQSRGTVGKLILIPDAV